MVKWKPEVKNFQIIAKSSPNNINIHMPMQVCMLFVCQSWTTTKVTFWFRCYTHWAMWFPCYTSDINKDSQNIILICTTMPNRTLWITVKWTMLYLSRKKLKTKLNKSLVSMCKFTHFHKIMQTYCWYHLWDRLSKRSSGNQPNTQRLQSLCCYCRGCDENWKYCA